MIFASSGCAHEREHIQNVRDFPQSKLDGEIKSPFLLNEQVFAKNSLIKNLYEEEKKFDSGTQLFFWKIVCNWVYFDQGEDFKLTTELSERVRYSATKQSKRA